MGNISNARICAAIFLRIEKERQRMIERRAKENCLKGHPNADSQISFYIYSLTGEDSGFADAYCNRCNESIRYALDEEAIADMKKARNGVYGGPVKKMHGENLDAVEWLESAEGFEYIDRLVIERYMKGWKPGPSSRAAS